MNVQLKNQLKKLYIIIIVWTALGVFLAVYDHLLLLSQFSLGFSEEYVFFKKFIFSVTSGFMGSVIGGSILIFYINRRFRSKPYFRGIIAVCVTFISVVALITVILATIEALVTLQKPLFEAATLARIKASILTTQHLKNIMFWAIVVALTQLTIQVNDKFGQGALWSLITGKYHFSKQEERIFMFLDLRSSTTIAEQLGNEQYHHLLKDLFADITDPILDNKGEIYQYVGDEVVISWKTADGVQNNHCINCYFDIMKTIHAFKEKYVSKYNILPEFKAGIHYGKVIAGEIGIIKRDITYSGDVLNTTARIQGKCNDYKVNLLSSKQLIDLLKFGQTYKTNLLGSISLKGKENDVELVALEKY